MDQACIKNYVEQSSQQWNKEISVHLNHFNYNGVTFSQFFSTYRWQHDVVRSNHVTNPRDHNILLLGTICLFIYNHTKEIEFYLLTDWLQDLWGRLQFGFQYIRQRQYDVVRSISTFLQEFQNLLEIFVPSPSELIISGDFNIHADSDLTTSHNFSGILDNFHLTQHINFPTHDDGHTLDLLITRSSSTVITHLSQHESYQSDHKSFTFKFFPHIRTTTERTTIQYRSYNTIDVDNFKNDILASPLYTKPASNASDLADQFSSTLRSILDIHAPIKTKTVVQRPHTPWINPEILQAKRERSRLERCCRRWKSPFDRKKFRAQCNSVRSLISKAKSSFLSNLVTESSTNPRTLRKTLNTILHRNPSNSFPESPDASSLVNTFLDFFKDKIDRIRTKFLISHSPDPFLFPPAPPPKMINFIPATLAEIYKLISASESKQCPLDSIPTFLLKLCFNELGPIITNLVNLSLSEGIFPSSFKQALVQPLLKNHLYPLMISTTFVQFQTSSSFPKFSKKSLLPAFNLTCLLTHCLLLFSLLTGSFILLKLLFLKSTMTSSLRWIVVRSLHSFFSRYLLPLILSIIPSFLLVFKIGSVLMVCLLIGSHLISHFALRLSQSMIPSLHSLLFPVVYPKVPYLAQSFLLSIQLLLAR